MLHVRFERWLSKYIATAVQDEQEKVVTEVGTTIRIEFGTTIDRRM